MKWKTMQAIIWTHIASLIPVFLLIVTSVEGNGDLVERIFVTGLIVAYGIGVLPLMYVKNRLWEKQRGQPY